MRGDAPIYYKKSRGLWACTIDLGHAPNGKRVRKELTSKNRNTLIRKRRGAIRAVEDNTFIAGKVPTVSAWMTHWLATIVPGRVRPTTLRGYESTNIQHITPHIGTLRLDKLTPDDVRFMHRQMELAGKKPSTVLRAHTILSKALKDAVREGVVGYNVCDRMDRPNGAATPRGAHSLAEVKALLQVAQADGPRWHSQWLTALTLGIRQGERLGMEWNRIDLDAGLIDLSWQLQELPWEHGTGCTCHRDRKPASCPHRQPRVPAGFEYRQCYRGRWFTRPKTTASIRMLPIPQPLLVALRQWRDEAPDNDYGLVWVNDAGTPIRPTEDRQAWHELCKRAGVRDLTVHTARHTMVTGLLEAGVDPEVIKQIAGHSIIASTQNYMHVSQQMARAALEQWSF